MEEESGGLVFEEIWLVLNIVDAINGDSFHEVIPSKLCGLHLSLPVIPESYC